MGLLNWLGLASEINPPPEYPRHVLIIEDGEAHVEEIEDDSNARRSS